MTRMVCPANGKRCACTEGSIRWLQCRGVALEAVRNLGAQPYQSNAAVQMARGFERRVEEAT